MQINQAVKAFMKIKNFVPLFVAAVGLLAATGARAMDSAALKEPVKSVYTHYLKIQASLANDSLDGVAENAGAIAEAVEGDSMKMLPSSVAAEAQTLAKASNLKSARAAFKPLSALLIQYLTDHNAKHAYVEVYCPMADASWLQANQHISNPYFGLEMPTCGEIKN